jgi:chlorite dismutase
LCSVLGAFTYPKNRQMSPVKVGATAVTDHAIVLIASLLQAQEPLLDMTTLVPGATQQSTQAPPPTVRQYIRYLFYKARPSWQQLPAEARAAARSELLAALEPFAERLPVLRAYSTLGTRADADFLLWTVTERLEDFQELQAAVLRSPMGAHLDTPYSYLAMTKRSQYVDRHEHADGDGEGRRTRIRPTGRQYLFVYPMVKKRPWYRLSLEERQRAMDEHIRVGHEFPRVKINTSYSFGLDDQEFVVAFETDYPGDFLDLVEKLRGGEASAYTERETPIFTCVAGSVAEVLELLG